MKISWVKTHIVQKAELAKRKQQKLSLLGNNPLLRFNMLYYLIFISTLSKVMLPHFTDGKTDSEILSNLPEYTHQWASV